MYAKHKKLTVFVTVCILATGVIWYISPGRTVDPRLLAPSLLVLLGVFYAREFKEAWLVYKINSSVDLKNRESARYFCRRLEELNPKSFNAQMAMGLRHAIDEDWHNAEKCYRKALTVNPPDPGAKYNLGVACLRLGRFRDALALFMEVAAIRPSWGVAYAGIGEVHWHLGNYRAAERFLMISLRLDKWNVGVVNLLNKVRSQLEQCS